jgi:hypothetical protein
LYTVPHDAPWVANGENCVRNVPNGALVQTNDGSSAAPGGGQRRCRCPTPREIRSSSSTSMITNRMPFRSSSPSHSGPVKKSSSRSKASKGPTMTRLNTSSMSSLGPVHLSTATMPFAPGSNQLRQPERVFGSPHGQTQVGKGFQTPGSSDQVPLLSERSASTDKLAVIEMHSVPPSSYPSCIPSPSRLSSSLANETQSQVTPRLFTDSYNYPE